MCRVAALLPFRTGQAKNGQPVDGAVVTNTLNAMGESDMTETVVTDEGAPSAARRGLGEARGGMADGPPVTLPRARGEAHSWAVIAVAIPRIASRTPRDQGSGRSPRHHGE